MSKDFIPIKFKELSEIELDKHLGEVIFTDNAQTTTVLDYCLNKKINHFVQKSNILHNKEISVSESMNTDPNLFSNFPLSVIHGERNPTPQTEKLLKKVSFEVENVLDKIKLLSEIEGLVSGVTKSTSLMHDILNTVDELFTNAVYNAPYVNFDNEKSGIDRNFENAVFETNKKPYLFAGYDQERIIVGCKDQYGSLNIEKLLSRIKNCYESNISRVINYGSGGAGIGAYLIFESSCSLYLNVNKGKHTLICCSFAYKLNATSRSQIPKNLHIYKSV